MNVVAFASDREISLVCYVSLAKLDAVIKVVISRRVYKSLDISTAVENKEVSVEVLY